MAEGRGQARSDGRLADCVDDALEHEAIIFGSLPPAGRDLDLLIDPAARAVLGARLEGRGFEPCRSGWIHWDGSAPQIVDAVDASSWGLPDQALERLWRSSSPFGSARKLMRPDPAHAILIIARRQARGGGELDVKHRARLDQELDRDPGGFEEARRFAPDWGAIGAVDLLERAYRGGERSTLARRYAAVGELELAAADSRVDGFRRALRTLAPRPRMGKVIALSGLDGSGKSTQVELLVGNFEASGIDVVSIWPAIDAPSRWLPLAASIGRRLLGLLGWGPGARGRASVASPEAAGESQGAFPGPNGRGSTLGRAWSLLVAARGAARLASSTWPHLLRGCNVICDRYTLDSWIYLHEHHDELDGYRFEMGLQRLAAPRPAAAYLLTIDPAEASRRQPERAPHENRRRAALYLELAPQLGVERIDGSRAREKVSAELTRRALAAIG